MLSIYAQIQLPNKNTTFFILSKLKCPNLTQLAGTFQLLTLIYSNASPLQKPLKERHPEVVKEAW